MTKSTQELAKLTADKQQAKLAELQQDLLEARRTNKASELVNPRVISKARKDIARLKTLLNQGKEETK